MDGAAATGRRGAARGKIAREMERTIGAEFVVRRPACEGGQRGGRVGTGGGGAHTPPATPAQQRGGGYERRRKDGGWAWTSGPGAWRHGGALGAERSWGRQGGRLDGRTRPQGGGGRGEARECVPCPTAGRAMRESLA